MATVRRLSDAVKRWEYLPFSENTRTLSAKWISLLAESAFIFIFHSLFSSRCFIYNYLHSDARLRSVVLLLWRKISRIVSRVYFRLVCFSRCIPNVTRRDNEIFLEKLAFRMREYGSEIPFIVQRAEISRGKRQARVRGGNSSRLKAKNVFIERSYYSFVKIRFGCINYNLCYFFFMSPQRQRCARVFASISLLSLRPFVFCSKRIGTLEEEGKSRILQRKINNLTGFAAMD